MSAKRIRPRLLHVEPLESRYVLSFIFPVELDEHHHGDHLHGDYEEVGGLVAHESRSAGRGGGGAPAPAIRLDLVALHEFGHALGLDHTSDTSSIMYAYYNGNYNLANFGSDSAVATLQALYANVATSAWKDSLDPLPGNGTVDVTYSFVPDGARMDKGTSTTFATFNSLFGAGNWQSIFAGELGRWAANSNGKLAFASQTDAGLSFNYSGASQNDSRSGDIRIAAHRFDGAGKVLAHTYFPPPNGSTAAGDAHFDQAEKWIVGTETSSLVTSGGSGGSRGNLVLGDWSGEGAMVLLVTLDADGPAADSIATTFVSADEDTGPSVQDVRSIGALALVSSSDHTQPATDWKDLASATCDEDEPASVDALEPDPSWLDAVARQRIEFGQMAR